MVAVFDSPEWSAGADEHRETSLTIDKISTVAPG
jgi:hypothetical protein